MMSPLTHVNTFLLRLRNRHFFALDVLILLATPALALMLRTDNPASLILLGRSLLVYTTASLVVKLPLFRGFGLYNRYWRYASIDELGRIAGAVVGVTVGQLALFFFVLRPTALVNAAFPRSLPLIEGLLVLLFVGGARYSVRLIQRMHQRQATSRGSRRVLVYGAGEAGLMIVQEMWSNPHLGLIPVAFADDDDEKHRLRIRGLEVVGGRDVIPAAVDELNIDLIVIAIPTASGKTVREVAAACRRTGAQTKTMPGVYELLDGQVTISQLRDVQVEDLLRRAPVKTDHEAVGSLIHGRRILVTGAGGSIGSELCRQILALEPAELVLLGHGENSIFRIEAELRRRLKGKLHIGEETRVASVICDIRDQYRLGHVLGLYRPDVVFHAAAHKHVPLMEGNVEEAVTNNVLGTRNLLRTAERFGVERFVLISSDKAVNPTSIMGVTKRIAEMLVQHTARRTGRAYSAVRFGNVLGSRGSVLEVWRKQIEQGGPITVTHPEIRRYFMTIPEAVHLVLQAGAMGRGGEVFLLDMGEPVRIVDLAEDLIRLSGLEVGRDIDVEITGLRPGEKLYEDLSGDGETLGRTAHEKVLVCKVASRDAAEEAGAGMGVLEAPHDLHERLDRLAGAARSGDTQDVVHQLADLVPTYHETKKQMLLEQLAAVERVA